MSSVDLKTELPISPEKVWETIGGFNALSDWHPAIEKSELEGGGSIRRLSLVGGGTIVEKLEKLDDDGHSYRYSIVDGPVPVANYSSEIKVTKNAEGGCTVHWSSDFTPKGVDENEAVKAVQGIYQAGFDNLRKMFGA